MKRRMVRDIKASYLAHGDFVYRHQAVPVFIRAEGVVLEDTEGYKYLCAEAANGTTTLGFDSSIISDALQKIPSLPSIPSFCETEIRAKLAERIGRKIEEITHMKGRVAFELGGAQGMELALKIVKSNTKKTQFVVFEGGYHGRSVYTSQLSASHRYRSLTGDWRIPVVRLPYPDYEQSGTKLGKATWKKEYMRYVKTLLHREVGGVVSRSDGEQDIAAFILEPLLNAGGIVKPDKDLVEETIALFKNLGAFIVIDEIFCGFHRTGPFFGFQHYDFKPDIIVMSKAITNGITPLSCIWSRDPLASPVNFLPGTHSATFVNQPFALAVADTIFDRYEEWKTVDRDMKILEKGLNKIVKKIARQSKLAVSGYAIGGVARILLRENIAGKILEVARTIGRNDPVHDIHGLILASTGMAPNVVALNPPLRLSSMDFEIIEKLLVRTFVKVEKQ